MAERRAVLPFLIGFTVLAGAAACIPIPNTVTLSPAIEGRYIHDDRTPIPGARVLLSTADNDSTCARPAVSAVTDGEGRFQLAATTRREQVILVIPNFDRMFCYQICGGRSEPLHRAERRCEMHSVDASQEVRCVEYPASAQRDSVRLACYQTARENDEA
ncbi:carboxypeptidase-like regulatory domain-containing protein [Longimicrobium sp.]|jgi:hypothetical protein|uniref:carboxypeptidase-like regulatory domain-containing protein n=1 Tax=Longimicrobium sp. TaxID=2029185 RepID=UPI002ED94A91